MSLSENQISYIKEVISKCLRDKFENYIPESSNMPFHYRLLGKDRMALYSFIHSLNTKFGTSIFEPVAVALAKLNFEDAKRQYVAGDKISEDAHKVIQNIIDGLTTGQINPNKKAEIEKIRTVCQSGKMNKVKPTKVDVYVKSKDGEIILFDLKTVKPNIGDFKEFKRTLLEWVATVLAVNPTAKVKTALAIPYNPYEPKPYERWTIKGMIDLTEELYVANEFWDFLGGPGAYQDLLGCFERVGIELRPEIDNCFKKFK
ncbi:MAG: TdeIII family type II restriction endonuclease [Candidatus Brocadia sp.]|jgi:type II restriction enzyme